MQLDAMLDRCRGLEERAGALYRAFAARARSEPALCALWTALAREEEEHARTLTRAKGSLDVVEGWRTRIDGWAEAVGEVEDRLRAAERLPSDAGPEEQLAAALELEMTELEAMRQALMTAAHRSEKPTSPDEHAGRLATHATRFSDDSHVRMLAALVLTRAHRG